MTKRLNISVPDDLFKKLEKWKGTINISKECQKHLRNLIEKKEKYEKRLMDVTREDTIERLKYEKRDFIKFCEEKYEKLGKEMSLEWVKYAHYEEIIFALKWGKKVFVEWEGGDIRILKPSKDENLEGTALFDYFNEIFKKFDLHWDDPSEDTLKFIEKWIVTLNHFWDEIKEKI